MPRLRLLAPLLAAGTVAMAIPAPVWAAGTSPTTTTLTTTQPSVTYGDTVHLTVQVQTAGAAPQSAPFIMEPGNIAVTGLYTPEGPGTWDFTTADLTAGTHSLTATFTGDAANAGSHSAPLTVDVAPSSTGVVLASSSDPSVPGQEITLRAQTFSPPGEPYATGQITFTDGATDLATVAVDGQGGALLSTSSLAAGTHSLTATYHGDANNLGATAALVQTVAMATPTERFVHQVYNDLLGRPADGGAAWWVSAVDRGTARAQVALAIAATPEYMGQRIDDIYLQYLDRTADPGGRDHWIDRLRQGATYEQIAESIVGSDEYWQANSCNGDVGCYITYVYQRALGRDPDGIGYQYWERRLIQGLPRWQLAISVVGGFEHAQDVVREDYVDLLGRDGDQGGVDSWATLIVHGVRDERVVAAIVGSGEYYQLSQAM